jgi:phytoene dehydrogenase-like protein
MNNQYPVVIIGAGMAGLTCAVYLQQAGIEALVLEAADGVGGRVRTDSVAGFQLDRGFQVLLTAYPEARQLLNYQALDLRPFRSGALIRTENGGWTSLMNPFQEPQTVFQTLGSSAGTFADKLLILKLLRHTQELPVDELFRQTPTTTVSFLHEMGFSEHIIEQFFRPFFGGVFLENALTTSSNFFEFCFRMFYTGTVAVPANGIGAIPAQLAARLKPAQIRLNAPVSRVLGHEVHLASGEVIRAGAVVLAVDKSAAKQLLGQNQTIKPEAETRPFNSTTCTYFAAPTSPDNRKLLMLNPNRTNAVHNVSVLTDVAPAFAPAGMSLISVSTQGLDLINEAALTERILKELTVWFGPQVQLWQHLKTYHLPEALPVYGPNAVPQPLRLAENLYQCGDQSSYPSLNAAMQTGRQVAEML